VLISQQRAEMLMVFKARTVNRAQFARHSSIFVMPPKRRSNSCAWQEERDYMSADTTRGASQLEIEREILGHAA